MAAVFKCATCKESMCGAAWFSDDAPTDRYGRIDRDYADSNAPRFCSEECKDNEGASQCSTNLCENGVTTSGEHCTECLQEFVRRAY